MTKRPLDNIDEVWNELHRLKKENPNTKVFLHIDYPQPAKTVRSDSIGEKVSQLVSQAVSNCYFRGDVMVLFHVVMNMTGGRFGFGRDDTTIVLMEERIKRFIMDLDPQLQYEFARQFLHEVNLTLVQVSLARNKLQLKQEMDDAAYTVRLCHLLKLCARYRLPLRMGTYQLYRWTENAYVLRETAARPQCIITFLVVDSGTITFREDVYNIDAAHDGVALSRLNVDITRKIDMNVGDILCKDPAQDTIIKWVAKGPQTLPGETAMRLYVLPPLLLRSIMAAEDAFRFFQTFACHAKKKKERPLIIPREAVQLIGIYLCKSIDKSVQRYLGDAGNDYYPRIESPHKTKANPVWGASRFDKQAHTTELISFKDVIK
jgi:hypothetical protein